MHWLQVRTVAKEREDALEAMKRQVYAKSLRLKSAQEALRNHRDELARKTECVVPLSRALQIGFKADADARRRLQVMPFIIQLNSCLHRQRRWVSNVSLSTSFPKSIFIG